MGRFECAIDVSVVPVTAIVSGDVDATSAATLGKMLVEAGRGGSSLRVDLRAVTYFDSSAVRALFDATALRPVTLVVPRGGAVARVMTISGIDQVTTVEFV